MSGAGGDKSEASRGNFDYWIVKVAPFEPADAYEADNMRTGAKVIRNNVLQRRSLHRAGDIDWARFTVGRASARTVRIETAGQMGDTELRLYDASGRRLAFDDDSGAGDFSRIALSRMASGRYWVQVREHGNNGVIPAYTLRVRWTDAVIAPDAYEPDDARTRARTTRNGRTQRKSIHAAGNRDWVKFTVGGRGATQVRLDTAGTSGDTQMWLYGPTGARVAYDDNSGPGHCSRIRRSALPAGTYTVRIQEKNNDGTIPAYTFRAQWTPQ